MNKTILTLVSLAISVSAFAQTAEWTLRTPFKDASDIIEAHITPDQTVHFLDKSAYSGVLISENQGATYKRALVSSNKDMHVVGDNTLFVLNDDKLVKTTNRFETSSFILTGSAFECVFFFNEDIGFVGRSNGQIRKTVDGGQNWENLTTGASVTLNDIFFLDANNGFACGASGTFLRTTDGGDTWNSVTLNGSSGYALNKITFFNPTQGIVAGVGGEVFYTSNAGLDWTQGTTNTLKQITDVKYVNGNLMATCHDGQVLTSADLGATWSIQVLNIWKDNLSITSDANGTVYVGSEGGIYVSADGLNWTFSGGVPCSELEYVSFADEQNGLITSLDQGGSAFTDAVLKTTDGGLSWQDLSISGDGYRGIHVLPTGEALTSQFNISQVALSSDFGDTWTTINGPGITTQYIARAVWLKSADDFFVGGGNYFSSAGIYRYQTGTGWTHNSSVGNVSRIQFLNNDFGVLCTIDNEAFKTTDGGDSWQSIGNASGVINIIDQNTFYIGDHVTYDGGDNLQFNTVPMVDYRFFDANNAIGVYTTGQVYQTSDAGATWQAVSTEQFPGPNCCNRFHIAENRIIAFGSNYNNADIYTLEIDNLITGFDDMKAAKSDILVYPNPTSDLIHIRGSVDQFTEALIYSTDGQQVQALDLSNGSRYLDVKNLSSGVYFIHLRSSETTSTILRFVKE